MTTSIEELLNRFRAENVTARSEADETSRRAVTFFANGDFENGINAGLDYIRATTERESAKQSEDDGSSSMESGNIDGADRSSADDVPREGTT